MNSFIFFVSFAVSELQSLVKHTSKVEATWCMCVCHNWSVCVGAHLGLLQCVSCVCVRVGAPPGFVLYVYMSRVQSDIPGISIHT